MKGQAQVITGVSAVFVVAIIVLIGLTVYGIFSDVVPHDRLLYNESICTTCVNETSYAFDNLPVLNDSTLKCTNGTGNDQMTNVGTDGDATCLTYNIIENLYVNLSNTSGLQDCYMADVVCDYTFDQANDNEQSFYNNNTTNTFAAFTLVAVLAIVLAAVVVVGLVMLFKA